MADRHPRLPGFSAHPFETGRSGAPHGDILGQHTAREAAELATVLRR